MAIDDRNLWKGTGMNAQANITQLLLDWKHGDRAGAEALLTPIVYDELRRLAAYYLRDERSSNTLQATALVHEAYLKLVAQDMPDWEGRSHFFGVAAHLMRQILVDHARRRHSEKRGSGVRPLPLEEALGFAPEKSQDIIALDDALTALAAIDERKCRVVELRFFAGLSIEETAKALNISVATIGREQRLAEAWLYREVSQRS